jgi:2-amino-4-hydroxy-6-hydroxymethyldihydropteridine diphosphokinase/dihydropteroate synthase
MLSASSCYPRTSGFLKCAGGTLDKNMYATVAELGVPYILMHMRGDPSNMQAPENTQYHVPIWEDVGKELRKQAQTALDSGLPAFRLILDPGLGFSKTHAGCVDLLGGLGRMKAEVLPGVISRLPMLVGPSRKGFVGAMTGAAVMVVIVVVVVEGAAAWVK